MFTNNRFAGTVVATFHDSPNNTYKNTHTIPNTYDGGLKRTLEPAELPIGQKSRLTINITSIGKNNFKYVEI